MCLFGEYNCAICLGSSSKSEPIVNVPLTKGGKTLYPLYSQDKLRSESSFVHFFINTTATGGEIAHPRGAGRIAAARVNCAGKLRRRTPSDSSVRDDVGTT